MKKKDEDKRKGKDMEKESVSLVSLKGLKRIKKNLAGEEE